MMRSQADLVVSLVSKGIVRSSLVERVLRQVDRREFGAPNYEDSPFGIGFGQTISAPHMHAYCLEWLLPLLKPGARVLDVGCGSGYLTACLALMVAPNGVVHGLEYLKELSTWSETNLRKSFGDGDGWQGLAEHGPFDVIHVGAAAESVPEALCAQLKIGGKMVIPVGPQGGDQFILLVDKLADGSIVQERSLAVRYVPLVKNS